MTSKERENEKTRIKVLREELQRLEKTKDYVGAASVSLKIIKLEQDLKGNV